eukprot:scaffold206412_cov35-Attheya_sp.AAC.2
MKARQEEKFGGANVIDFDVRLKGFGAIFQIPNVASLALEAKKAAVTKMALGLCTKTLLLKYK